MATTRAASANIARMINSEDINQIPANKAHILRPRTAAQASQRNTLGDIGNRVSSINISEGTKKGGIITKEIIKPAQKALVKSKATVSLRALAEPNVQEQDAFRFMEPAPPVSKTTAVVLPQQTVPAPMDTSEAEVEAFSKALFNVQDIDVNDKDNPQLVSEYVNDIYNYMRVLESKYPIKKAYLDGQEISGKMRAILIDWLCQVHHRFHLLQETLYLSIAIIDRYLQFSPVTRTKLQLVGVTSMLIASKYEEMYAPEVADFVYITDNAYSKKEILQMEGDILRTLNFSFGRPLCLHFLRRNSKAGQVDANKHTLAKYLMELTIVEYDMVHYSPSEIAAAALCLSMKLLDKSQWTETLAHYSSYPEKELMPTIQKLASLVVKSENSKLTAVRTKYASSKFFKISTIPELKCQELKDLAAKAS